MSILTDPLFGTPIGAEPRITTWRSARTDPKRATMLVSVPSGAEPPRYCSLWESGRYWRGETVDIYRTRRLDLEPSDNPGGLRAWALPWVPLPVSAAEMDSARASMAAWAPGIQAQVDMVIDHARATRGDPVDPQIARIERSPWTMTMREADDAAIMRLTTAHLYRGVREEHGRWQGYVGLGGMLRIVCTCDTREEALTIATAHLWESWVTRVREIRELRGGDLSWGWEIPSPVLAEEDPQASY